MALDPVVDGLSRAANGSGQRRLPAGNFDCFYKCVHADILHTWGIKSQHVKYAQEASGAPFRRFRASVPRFALAEFFCAYAPHVLTILNTCVEYVHRLSSASPTLLARRVSYLSPTDNKDGDRNAASCCASRYPQAASRAPRTSCSACCKTGSAAHKALRGGFRVTGHPDRRGLAWRITKENWRWGGNPGQ